MCALQEVHYVMPPALRQSVGEGTKPGLRDNVISSAAMPNLVLISQIS